MDSFYNFTEPGVVYQDNAANIRSAYSILCQQQWTSRSGATPQIAEELYDMH